MLVVLKGRERHRRRVLGVSVGKTVLDLGRQMLRSADGLLQDAELVLVDLLATMVRAGVTCSILQVLHRVDVGVGDAAGRQATRCLLVLLKLAIKVFVLDLIIQVRNARVVVDAISGGLTIDERVAIDETVFSKRLGDTRRARLRMNFTRSNAAERELATAGTRPLVVALREAR